MPKWIALIINLLMIGINVPFALQGSMVNIITIVAIAVLTTVAFGFCWFLENEVRKMDR